MPPTVTELGVAPLLLLRGTRLVVAEVPVAAAAAAAAAAAVVAPAPMVVAPARRLESLVWRLEVSVTVACAPVPVVAAAVEAAVRVAWPVALGMVPDCDPASGGTASTKGKAGARVLVATVPEEVVVAAPRMVVVDSVVVVAEGSAHVRTMRRTGTRGGLCHGPAPAGRGMEVLPRGARFEKGVRMGLRRSRRECVC